MHGKAKIRMHACRLGHQYQSRDADIIGICNIGGYEWLCRFNPMSRYHRNRKCKDKYDGLRIRLPKPIKLVEAWRTNPKGSNSDGSQSYG